MPRLTQDFNWGKEQSDNPLLYRQLSEAYSDTAGVVNTKISKYITNGTSKPNVDPPANDQFNKNWEIGDIYVRTDTNKAWIMTSRTTQEAVTWTQIT